MPGEGDAEVSKTASATAEDTETVTKTFGLHLEHGQRLVFESLEYGFPNQSDQSVKNKYTNIQIQLLPYSISGNGQDMRTGWQLAATILVMTFYLVLPKHSLHTDILGP